MLFVQHCLSTLGFLSDSRHKLTSEGMSTFSERAWSERVKAEDRAVLEHTEVMQRFYEAKRRQEAEVKQQATKLPSVHGNTDRTGERRSSKGSNASVASSIRTADGSKSLVERWRKTIDPAAPVGSSLVPDEARRGKKAGGSRSSLTGSSVFTSTSVSHRGYSSVAVTGMTEFNERLALLEQRLEQEKKTRDAVVSELQQIKQLLLSPANPGTHAAPK